MKKIFIINCNAKKDSLRQPYIDAYIEEARKNGNEVKYLNVYDLEFGCLSYNENTPITELSEGLKQAQTDIIWADQLVISYPVWCIGMPAKLKSLIELIFQKDVLVGYGKYGPVPILKNKTMVLIQSYDMPYIAMKYFFGDLSARQLQITLDTWCGFKMEKRFDLDRISSASDKTREKWLAKIRKFASKVK